MMTVTMMTVTIAATQKVTAKSVTRNLDILVIHEALDILEIAAAINIAATVILKAAILIANTKLKIILDKILNNNILLLFRFNSINYILLEVSFFYI